MSVKIHVKETVDDQFYVQVRARNGKVLAHSEGYKRKRDAEAAAVKIAGAVLA